MAISSALGSSALLPAGLGFRNKIINGGFDIWQRGTSFTTNGAYTADRWQMAFGGTSTTQTASQVALTVGTLIDTFSPQYHMRNVVAGGSGTSSLVVFTQKIEDVRTCSNQSVVVSFYAKVSSGTANLGLDLYQEFGSGGSSTVGGIGGQKFSLTTSWQKFTATILVPSISGKTVGAGSLLACRFWFSSGSDYNSFNGSLGIQSNTFDIWGVQLEQNYQPTPFEQRPIGVELDMCFRYYQRMVDPAGVGVKAADDASRVLIPLYTRMRAQPTSTMSGTMNFWNGSSTGTATSFTAVFNSVSQGQIDFAGGVGTAGQANSLYTTGGSQYIDFSSEL
jgi:hypothetical protein